MRNSDMRYFQIPDRKTQIRVKQYLNSDHICFKSDKYPIYFYLYAGNRINGWETACITGMYKDIYEKAYPADVLLYPDRYPEYFI